MRVQVLVQGTTAAGVPGIGAVGRAVAMQRARSRTSTNTTGLGAGGGDYPGYKERTSYTPFAGPGRQPHEMYDQDGGVPRLRYRPGSQEADLLEVVSGLGLSAAGAGAGEGPAFINRRPSEPTHLTDLAR